MQKKKKAVKTKKKVVSAKKKAVAKKKSKALKSVSIEPKVTLEELFDDFFQAQPLQALGPVKKEDKSLDVLFDELFKEPVRAPKPAITLEDLFSEPEPKPDTAFDEMLNEMVDELNKEKAPTSTIFTSIVTPARTLLDDADVELAALSASKHFFSKLFTAMGVTVAAALIGLMWLQVTYGYFSEIDNISSGDAALQQVIDKNAGSLKEINLNAQSSFQKAQEAFGKLKGK